MQAMVKEITTRRRDYFLFVSLLRFGHSATVITWLRALQ